MAKKPVQSKEIDGVVFDPIFTDRTAIPAKLAEHLTSRGYEYRWINFNRFRADGFHKTQWVPFKRTEETPMTEAEELMGVRPDGFIVRGDMVLAVKKKELAEAYRKHIAEKNKIMSRAVSKTAADQLKSTMREAGIKAKIHSGYEEN